MLELPRNCTCRKVSPWPEPVKWGRCVDCGGGGVSLTGVLAPIPLPRPQITTGLVIFCVGCKRPLPGGTSQPLFSSRSVSQGPARCGDCRITGCGL
jgi:hypothetical protein